MSKKKTRVITAAGAICFSLMIVMALSYAGNATKGPIELVLTNTGEMVKNMEEKLIVEKRSDTRESKMQRFQAYLNNKKLALSPSGILLGAYDNEGSKGFQRIISLEDSLKTTIPLIQIFVAWGSGEDHKFPATQVRNILQLGSLPVITWEPWLTAFTDEQVSGLRNPEDRDKNGLKDVAAGAYDSYIREWAAAAKKVNKTIFLRFGQGMNDAYHYPWGPQNNSAPDYIAAYRHVHQVFDAEGATNIVWIWSPHPAYDFRDFYPGSEFVDYVGVGALNYGSVAVWSKWWSFKDIFGNYYDSLAAYNKPIMITEFGSLSKGGNRVKWFADALDSLPAKYPLVKSVIFFQYANDNHNTKEPVDWTINEDRQATARISRAINDWK